MKDTVLNHTKPSDDIFHKEIIDTFFGKPKKREPTSPEPQPRKVPTSQKNATRLTLTLFSFLFLLFVVSITILLVIYWQNRIPETTQVSNYTKLLSNGAFDRSLTENFFFDGDAKEKSLILRDSIKLVNTGRLGWARVTFTLKNDQNLKDANILLFAKSYPGAKHIILILTDKNGNTHKIPMLLSPRWERKNIHLSSGPANFEIDKINSIAIEFGSVTAQNRGNTVISLKELGIRKQ